MRVDQRYSDGREIHVGDRVRYNNQPGRIVFVADRGEFAEGYEWKEHSSGFMIAFDNGARVLLDAPDQLLVFEGAHA
jgi:hypothetical protein